MNHITITETFGVSHIKYVPNGRFVEAYVDGEQQAKITGDSINAARAAAFARIRREAGHYAAR